MEKKVQDIERVENNVENELKVKCQKREREQIKKKSKGKKKEHMPDLCKKELTNK